MNNVYAIKPTTIYATTKKLEKTPASKHYKDMRKNMADKKFNFTKEGAVEIQK